MEGLVGDVLSTPAGKLFGVCLGLMAIGCGLMRSEGTTLAGKLLLYCGGQSFMGLYMGWVMRTSVTVPQGTYIPATNSTLEADLTGCPAGFALVALQQIVSFGMFALGFAALYFTPHRYTPRPLENRGEVISVAVFGIVFALNTAMNNLSLGYISIAMNLVIKSSFPLTTYASEKALAACGLYRWKPCSPLEFALMSFGVACALVFTIASILGQGGVTASSHSSVETVFGVLVCVGSLICGSVNLGIAGILGEKKLNVFDSVAYMSVPATLILLPLAFFVDKPVPGQWGVVFGVDRMTDIQILAETWRLNKATIMWLALSGVFSFIFNIVRFSVVHTMSPAATAAGGNFNKAALIFLTLAIPALRSHPLPGMPHDAWIWGSVVLNILAFTWYSHLQIQSNREVVPDKDASRPLSQMQVDLGTDESNCEDSAVLLRCASHGAATERQLC